MKTTFSLAVVFASALTCSSVFAADDIDAGKALTAKYSCAACHGANFNSPIDPSYPKLAGQQKSYLEYALIGYKRGSDSANGRSNAIMGGQVKPLSDLEIKNIAAYIHSLPGSLVLRK
ncbi:MAG: cytochrome c [Glaciimonas sp.]|nr:cytochrome c [Glaciimonas sp.]